MLTSRGMDGILEQFEAEALALTTDAYKCPLLYPTLPTILVPLHYHSLSGILWQVILNRHQPPLILRFTSIYWTDSQQ